MERRDQQDPMHVYDADELGATRDQRRIAYLNEGIQSRDQEIEVLRDAVEQYKDLINQQLERTNRLIGYLNLHEQQIPTHVFDALKRIIHDRSES